MKKVTVLALIVFGNIFFSSYNTPKQYTFIFTDAQIGALYGCLQKSTAPYTDVAPLLKEIESQYQTQVIDTTKKK